jgi:hypothetical protein
MPTTSRRWPFIAAIVVLIVHGAFVFRLGVFLSPDSIQFSRWADLLLASGFDYGTVVREAGSHNVPTGMYMLFATLVALAKLVAGAEWAAVLIAANVVFDALTAAVLIHLVFLATRSTAAVMLALVAWILCFDVVTWVRMPLTDVPFLLAGFAAFASLAAPRLASRRFTKKSLTAAALLTAAGLLLRPVGFVWIVLMAIVFLVVSRRAGLRRVVVISLLVAAAIFALHTFVVRHPERWPIPLFERSVRWDARSYERGDVVLGRPETSHARPSTFVDYAAITADRFVHFFAFISASFSARHNLMSAAFYGALYLLAIVAVIAATSRDSAVAEVVILSALIVLAVAFWHSLVVIDFDWRYRLPILPHLIFMAACGATTVRPTPSHR